MSKPKLPELARRYISWVSLLGTTQLHLQNPYIVAWWSAAFPGFGHILLSKYTRGIILVAWEIYINMQAHINGAMIYSFTGQFEQAKDVLEPRWMLLYIPVYMFAIWDSYRTTVDLNKLYLLADHEKGKITAFQIGSMGINYLDKRIPSVTIFWSILIPGMGQLYIHRLPAAFLTLLYWIIFCYYSHLLEALHFIVMGQLNQSIQILNPEWLLFMPSLYGFALYDSYVMTVENNKLFQKEQTRYLEETYQPPRFNMPKRNR